MLIDKNKITVAVGMSGGVDSSVAAALLVEQGYNVIGLTMKTYDFMEVGGNIVNESNCCDLRAVNDARAVADKLGIRHYVVNLREEFNDVVINNFVDEYMNGRTPNPCIICNKRIKWGILSEHAEKFGADRVATGHYASVRIDDIKKRYVLSRGRFAEKDQSYALWAVTQEALSKTIFPLSDLTKPQVRTIAEQHGLINARKQESFEICFIPDDDYVRFLNERIPDLKMKVADGDILLNGKIAGKHDGYPFYTIGQRRNIGAFGKKMYVTSIDCKNNTVMIGTDAELHHRTLIAGEVNWGSLPGVQSKLRVKAKVRYKDEATDAAISMEGDGRVRVTFDLPKRAITPGQSVVVYDGNDVLCGGIIEQILE